MLCCFRRPATQEGAALPLQEGSSRGAAAGGAGSGNGTAADGPPVVRRRSASLEVAPRQSSATRQHQQQLQQQQQGLGNVSLEPLARLGEGAAQQAPGLQPTSITSPHSEGSAPGGGSTGSQQHQHHQQQQQQGVPAHLQAQLHGSEDGGGAGGAPQSDVLQLVALLQELLGLSTASPRQPLSKAMALLVVRLPVDWACLHVFSASGRVVMQVGSALSPEAQRQRGASGSCSYATPVGTTLVRGGRVSYSNMLPTSSSGSAAAGSGAPGSSAGVQEVGAGHLAVLPGSGSSLELVSASRQAVAMYAGDEGEAAALPPDWQRLYADRDLRSFLVVPIIASGSAGSIIGALSFGLTCITDWGMAWWMNSIQLLCGWAAGALPQNRATARAAFFDALWSAADLQDVGRVFVNQLPAAMADPAQHKLEARLALVSSRVASCVMFAGLPDSSNNSAAQDQQQQQQQQAKQQQAAQADPGQHQKQQQQQQQQQESSRPGSQRGSHTPGGRSPSPSVVPEGVILQGGGDDTGVWQQGLTSSPQQQQQQQPGATNHSTTSSSRRSKGQLEGGQEGSSHPEQQQQEAQEQQHQQQPEQALNGMHEPVSRFTLPTSNSVLLSALEWGEVMVVKDTVTYFGRNAAGQQGGSSSAVRDLFLPDRPMVRGTLVLLPLVFRCRAVGCVYLLAPWDIHAELGKAALQEMAALLAGGTFKALLRGGRVQAEWYSQVLSEGPMPSVPELVEVPVPAAGATTASTAAATDPSGGGAAAQQGGSMTTTTTSSCTPAAAASSKPSAAAPEKAVTAPLSSHQASAAAAIAAASSLSSAVLGGAGGAAAGVESAAAVRSKSPAAGGGDAAGGGSSVEQCGPQQQGGVGQQQLTTGSCDSVEPSALSGTAAATATGFSTTTNALTSCPVPLSSPEAVMAAAAAASSAAAAAAAIAPVGLPVSGHAAVGFTDLVLWPELLDIKADLARSRHTAVYTAEYGGHLLALKLFRYSTAMDSSYAAGAAGSGAHPGMVPQLHGAGAGAAGAGGAAGGIGGLLGHHGPGGSSGGHVANEAELEAVLSLQYRLCNMSHLHLLQHVAIYPRVFEVVQRRSSREPPDVYLAAVVPRKERHHRCAALISEYAGGGCLRDAVNRGQVHVPTAAALQAAATALGWGGASPTNNGGGGAVVVDVSRLTPSQLQELMAQVAQQVPVVMQQTHQLPPGVGTVAGRTSQEYSTTPQGSGVPLVRLQQQQSAAGVVASASAPLPPPGPRLSQELQSTLREPFMPLLRQLLLHIALGMQHLHTHGIVHGELRLDNVMISGALPSTPELLLQQRLQHQAAAGGGSLRLSATAEEPPTSPPLSAVVNGPAGSSGGGGGGAVVDVSMGECVGRAGSSLSSYSTGGGVGPDMYVGASGHGSTSSSSHMQPGVGSGGAFSSASPSSPLSAVADASGGGGGGGGSSNTTAGGFVLKLKDVGLCTVGFSNRQCVLRKLAGRPRLQAVSWLAPECFRGEGLSKYSDVYAFGILMWELYTAQVAFNDLVTSNTKVLQTIIGDGVRPQFSDSTPAWYVSLAQRCWAGAPKSRPSFRRIVQALQAAEDTPPTPLTSPGGGAAAGSAAAMANRV